MNQELSINDLVANAACLNDPAIWETIARRLLAERPAPKKARTVKSDDSGLLSRTERLALGLAPLKEPRFASGSYQWVLVTFADGLEMLVGQYPRKAETGVTPAMRSARFRYLLALSGGRLADASMGPYVPAITGARELADAAEIERERERCLKLRLARFAQ